MAGRGDIEAGKSFIRLYVKDSGLLSGLANAGKSVAGFAATAAVGIAGFGAAAISSLAGAATIFANSGDELNKMSERTGASVEALSQLRYAAGQSGAGLEDLQKALIFMAKKGGTGDPVANLEALADRLAGIADPGERARVAIEEMGKGGAALLPLMKNGAAGIAELRKEADELGLTFTQEMADNATDFGDAWDRVTAALEGAVITVGGAVAPAFTNIAGIIKQVVVVVADWLRANDGILSSFNDITSVLASGNFALAGQIAMGELKLAVLDGLTLIEGLLGESFGNALGKIGTQILGGDFSGAWNTAVLGMAVVWDAFTESIVGAFTESANVIVSIWETATTAITKFVIDNQKRIKDLVNLASLVTGGVLLEKLTGTNAADSLLGPDIRQEDRSEAKRIAGQQISGTASGLRDKLSQLNEEAAARSADSTAAFGADIGRGGAAASAAVAQKAELDRLKEEARVAAEARRKGEQPGLGEGITSPKGPGTLGTFSAAAAALFGGGGAQERIARATEQSKKLLEETKELQVQLVFAVTGMADGLKHPG